MKILEICIPTYNRYEELQLLINHLKDEIKINSYESTVDIVIYDNNSPKKINLDSHDDFIRLVKSDKNIGGVGNIVKCMQNAKAKYVWILGDDDYPMKGLLSKIINLFRSNVIIDLIYLPTRWYSKGRNEIKAIKNNVKFQLVNSLNIFLNEKIEITFLSCAIYNRENYINYKIHNYSRLKNTMFPHLEVTLTLLNNPESSVYLLNKIAISATGGESGGYQVINAFNNEVPEIINKKVSNIKLIKIICERHKIRVLKIILALRRGRLGKFDKTEQMFDGGLALIDNQKISNYFNMNIIKLYGIIISLEFIRMLKYYFKSF
jgi:hypothetical protein